MSYNSLTVLKKYVSSRSKTFRGRFKAKWFYIGHRGASVHNRTAKHSVTTKCSILGSFRTLLALGSDRTTDILHF